MTEGSEELKPARHTLSCVPSRDSGSLVQFPRTRGLSLILL